VAFIDDLDKAVGMFSAGMDRLNQTQAFNKASERINEINTTVTNEMEKRNQLNAVSQELGRGLIHANAPISRIQAALTTYGAPALPSAEEQIEVGVQFDDKESLKTGQAKQIATGAVKQQRALDLQVAAAGLKAKDKKAILLSGTKTNQAIQKFVPDNLRKDAYNELGGLQKTRVATQKLDTYFKESVSIGLFSGKLPFSVAKTRKEQINANILGVAGSVVKGNPSDKEFILQMAPYQIQAGDTEAQANERIRGFRQFLQRNAPPTPVLDQYNIPGAHKATPAEKGRTSRDLIADLRANNWENLSPEKAALLTVDDIKGLPADEKNAVLKQMLTIKGSGK